MSSFIDEDVAFAGLIGRSNAMQHVHDQIILAASNTHPVLITGEAGVGKRLCARIIHTHSLLHKNPFVDFVSSTLDKEYLAEKLNEIKEATFFFSQFSKSENVLKDFLIDRLQTKQKGRMIFSSSRPTLIDQVSDLIHIDIPPLRNRPEDIIDITHYLLQKDFVGPEARAINILPDAVNIMKKYSWPGNVRELKHFLTEACVKDSDSISLPISNIPDSMKREYFNGRPAGGHGFEHIQLPLLEIEKRVIQQTIQYCGGSVPKAARILCVSPSTLYRKMRNWSE